MLKEWKKNYQKQKMKKQSSLFYIMGHIIYQLFVIVTSVEYTLPYNILIKKVYSSRRVQWYLIISGDFFLR